MNYANIRNLISILVISIVISSCANTNNAQFGNNILTLEYSEIQAKTANLMYINQNQGIMVGVIRDVMPNADAHLSQWTKAMIKEQEKFRGNKLIAKQSNGITYYEVFDKAQQAKIIYIFGVNQKNTALLMKFSKFEAGISPSIKYIKNLYSFKAF
ncbi:MAG: hypothetical protein ACRCXK_05885 [Wohlfahrtiimonas sp.]